jgi:hypothetical protein
MPQPKQGTYTNISDSYEKAIDAADRFLLIRAKLDKELVKVGEPARLSVEFFDPLSREQIPTLVDPRDEAPIVVALDDVGQDEGVIKLWKADVGKYSCDLVPKTAGTRTYLIKEDQGTDQGQLVELEVLNPDDYQQAKLIWRKWANGYKEWIGKRRNRS